MTFFGNVVSFAARARSARAANDTTRAQINNIFSKRAYVGLCMPMQGYVLLCGVMCGQLRLCSVNYGFVGLCSDVMALV